VLHNAQMMRRPFFSSIILPFLAALCVAVQSQALPPQQPSSSIDVEEYEKTLASSIMRVPEFEFIRSEAKEMGVRIWLFGGTAAAFAHYVKWDLQRQNGDARFQPERFDYDYTNIFRSNQDMDIVIDGPAEKAMGLQRLLQQRFPYFQGQKPAWEVRLLRDNLGDKEALLNNPDFLNQNTDSNSTGMIEVTEPEAPADLVKDLRDWDNPHNHFLMDVLLGKLHFYFSPSHGKTSRAKRGVNPPILSVVRYLTKAFQYALKIEPEDLKILQELINDFSPEGDVTHFYVKTWLEKNGQKLMENAVDVEYAWNTLEKLGLRTKLGALGTPNIVYSLSWWMNKEPLRSRPVGQGNGKTAKEIFAEHDWFDNNGGLTVAHETRNYFALESITRAHTGAPNVFISREHTPGEAAACGPGFYTQVGRRGAVGTGLTIRFKVDPGAREGADFIISGGYLVFRNKEALRVVPESLNLSPLQYFEMLAKGTSFDDSDRGILEKLRRRVQKRLMFISKEEFDQIFALEEKMGPSTLLASDMAWNHSKAQLYFRFYPYPGAPRTVEEFFGQYDYFNRRLGQGTAGEYATRYFDTFLSWDPDISEIIKFLRHADTPMLVQKAFQNLQHAADFIQLMAAQVPRPGGIDQEIVDLFKKTKPVPRQFRLMSTVMGRSFAEELVALAGPLTPDEAITGMSEFMEAVAANGSYSKPYFIRKNLELFLSFKPTSTQISNILELLVSGGADGEKSLDRVLPLFKKKEDLMEAITTVRWQPWQRDYLLKFLVRLRSFGVGAADALRLAEIVPFHCIADVLLVLEPKTIDFNTYIKALQSAPRAHLIMDMNHVLRFNPGRGEGPGSYSFPNYAGSFHQYIGENVKRTLDLLFQLNPSEEQLAQLISLIDDHRVIASVISRAVAKKQGRSISADYVSWDKDINGMESRYKMILAELLKTDPGAFAKVVNSWDFFPGLELNFFSHNQTDVMMEKLREAFPSAYRLLDLKITPTNAFFLLGKIQWISTIKDGWQVLPKLVEAALSLDVDLSKRPPAWSDPFAWWNFSRAPTAMPKPRNAFEFIQMLRVMNVIDHSPFKSWFSSPARYLRKNMSLLKSFHPSREEAKQIRAFAEGPLAPYLKARVNLMRGSKDESLVNCVLILDELNNLNGS